MHLDNANLDDASLNSVIIGYDLRVFSDKTFSSIQVSLDPTIWPSCRDINQALYLNIYEIKNISDISNGLNLAVLLPKKLAPTGYTWAMFDAPENIVQYMCKSFGLQYSISENSNRISKNIFTFLGYDIVDLWTQSSYLFQFGATGVKPEYYNKFTLISSAVLAKKICKIADEFLPDYSPFQPIGIWVSKLSEVARRAD